MLAFLINLCVICVFAEGFYGVVDEGEVRLPGVPAGWWGCGGYGAGCWDGWGAGMRALL